jgi:hypothetical protein
VLPGTGRTFIVAGFVAWPPNVAMKLLTKLSRSAGET